MRPPDWGTGTQELLKSIGDGVEHTMQQMGFALGEPGGWATRSELDPANWAPVGEAQVKSVMVCPGTQLFHPGPQRIRFSA